MLFTGLITLWEWSISQEEEERLIKRRKWICRFIGRCTWRDQMRNENINQIKSETMRITGQNASTVRRKSNNPLSSSIFVLHRDQDSWKKAGGELRNPSWQEEEQQQHHLPENQSPVATTVVHINTFILTLYRRSADRFI